ncbi:oxaloacetate-decarboxylating malate dehydrogenase [Caedibacter taeniospiralis]|uniref:oxaloacetate-decarboxylating malate dehydrogenase n=1 Tax=Caedibacter taeniospiralis TaxID=28907 RepID=UPI00227783E2|nr:oxaloacetate-decarboxylating malate dehydrogenase [Caedibacter taeniospiralis]
MVQLFIEAVKEEMPETFLHWEDFGRDNARKNLLKYQNEICSFNHDVQGTAAVALAALISAAKRIGVKFNTQKFVVFGAGTAGLGIADEIVSALVHSGLTKEQAYQRFWCIDKDGLLIVDQEMMDFQRPYACTRESVKGWVADEAGRISLVEVVKQAKPTTLIGCSGVANAFTDEVIIEMARNNQHPIIFTLSNPTSRCERVPEDVIRLTNGQALVATGSPFEDVGYKGKVYRIAQSNNALVFPGIGLGIVAIGAKRFTDNMLWAACKALANYSTQDDALLPKLSEAYSVSRQVAFAVARQAIADGVAEDVDDIWRKIDQVIWEPKYYPYYLKK